MRNKREIIILDSKFMINSKQRKKLDKFLRIEFLNDSGLFLTSFKKEEVRDFADSHFFHRSIEEIKSKTLMKLFDHLNFKSRSFLIYFDNNGIFYMDLESEKIKFFKFSKVQEDNISLEGMLIPKSDIQLWKSQGTFLVHSKKLYQLKLYTFDKGPDTFEKFSPALKNWAIIYVGEKGEDNSHRTYFSSFNE